MTSNAETTTTGFPLVIPTKSMLPAARLVIRNDLGQIIQQWLLRQSKCTLGSSAGCTLRCDAPGIAPYHALIVVGARQTFVRGLAPRLSRNGIPVSELLLSDAENEFEIAGHHFSLLLGDTEQASTDTLSDNDHSSESGRRRLKFTLARPLVINQRRAKADAVPNSVALAGDDEPVADSKWVARMVQEAIEPLECQLQNLLEPLTKLQKEARQQRLLQAQLLEGANSNSSEDSTPIDPALARLPEQLDELVASQSAAVNMLSERLDAALARLPNQLDEVAAGHSTALDLLSDRLTASLARLPGQLEELAARQSAAAELLSDRLTPSMSGLHGQLDELAASQSASAELLSDGVAAVNKQLTVIEQLVQHETEARTSELASYNNRDAVQSEAIEQLQTGMLTVSNAIQDLESRQQAAREEDRGWRSELQAEIIALRQSVEDVSARQEDIAPSAVVSQELATWQADVQSQLKLLQESIQQVSERAETVREVPTENAEDAAWRAEVQEQFTFIRAALESVSQQTVQASMHSVDPIQSHALLESGELESGQLETGQLETGQLETGQLETGQLETGELETGELETGELETGELESGGADEEINTVSTSMDLNPEYPPAAPSAQAEEFATFLSTADSEAEATESPASEFIDADPFIPESTAASEADNDTHDASEIDASSSMVQDFSTPVFDTFGTLNLDANNAEPSVPAQEPEAVSDPSTQTDWVDSIDENEDVTLKTSAQDDIRQWDESSEGDSTVASERLLDAAESNENDESEFFGLGVESSPEQDVPGVEFSADIVSPEAVTPDLSPTDEFPSNEAPTNSTPEEATFFDSTGEQLTPEHPYHPTVQLNQEFPEDETSENALPQWWTEEEALQASQTEVDDEFSIQQDHLAREFTTDDRRLDEMEGATGAGAGAEFGRSSDGLTNEETLSSFSEASQSELENHALDSLGQTSQDFGPESLQERDGSNAFSAMESRIADSAVEAQGTNEYESLFGAEDPDALQQEAEQTLEASPAAEMEISPQDHHAEGEDGSVEDYMRKLLARMRGATGEELETPAPTGNPEPEPASVESSTEGEVPEADSVATVADEQPAPTTKPIEDDFTTEPFDPDTYVPRGVAPEKVRNLAAMRELANSSARTAIHSSTRKRHLASSLVKSSISVIGILVGCVLIGINGFQVNIGLVATVAAFLVGAIWGYDALTSVKPLLQSRLVLRPEAENDADESEEVTDRQS